MRYLGVERYRPMAVFADMKHRAGQNAWIRKLSWPVFLLTLLAVTSSLLSALSLYQLSALRAELEGLKSEISHRREDGEKVSRRPQLLDLPESRQAFSLTRQRRRTIPESYLFGPLSCLQLLGNSTRKPFRKELPSGPYTGIPWETGLRTGTALEADRDRIQVREDGFYFVYSQVYYTDSTFTMGHVVIRWKRNIVGNEDQDVHLFRCIQSMNPTYAFNTCYTGGIVKLESGDYLELLIPRPMANISLDGDSTFMGALKLA